MASLQQPTGSGSEEDARYAIFDEKKRKRMISNRESARRSRMRKQKHVDELLNQVNQLKVQNSLYSDQIDATSQMYVSLASQNNVLRAQTAELTDRLKSLNCVIEIVAEANGLAVDIPEIPEILLEPWQLPCPIQPITASADMFQY